MELTFTYWGSRYVKEAKVITSSWSDWRKELEVVQATDKKKDSLPGLVLGRMVEGDRRTNKNVKTVEALALDIERGDQGEAYVPRLEHALERLADLEYVAYTTYSHTEASPRLRIIVPLSKPIAPSDYKGAMSYLNCLTGNVADLAAQKLSQPVYLPYHAEDCKEQHWSIYHEGNILALNTKLIKEVVAIRGSLGEGLGKAPSDAHVRQACKAVLQGRSYSDEGNRDETATRIAWHLSKHHQDASLEAIGEVFHWSIRDMGEDAPDAENIHSKLLRGGEKRVDELEGQPMVEPERIAVVQYRASYYFRLREGGFSRAFTKDEARLAAYKHLRGLPGVQINYMNDQGKPKRKTVDRLIEEYGDLADDVLIDLTIPQAKFENGTLSEATVTWPTHLTPQFDPQINKWLELLGGEKLKDWLSILADLNRLSSALVIMGPRNIGKTLLAMGCASRFGSNAPAKQHALTGRFQEELARCPLVYIDEDIEENPYDRNFLATIRSELSIRERSMNRKYLAPVQMNGAIRCIISANHLPFRQKDSQTGQDLAAIAERFYWINAKGEAATYLEKVGPDKINHWRKVGMAQHIMHLEETRTISKEKRFGVSGDSEKLADLINISVRWNSWVTEWICNGVMDGFSKLNTGDRDIQGGGVIHNKEVFVRVKTIVAAWDRYLKNNRTAPDTRPISEAIRGIAEPGKKYQPKELGVEGNNQQRFYKIRRSPLLTFLDQTGSGTAAELVEALERGNQKGR